MADYPKILSPDGMLTIDQLDSLSADQIETLAPEHQAQLLTRLGHKRALNRRRFLGGLAASGVAVAGAGLLAGCGDSKKMVVAAGPSETDVLNFALNLEYLEAQFYSFATTGAGLSATVTGSGAGTVSGGIQTAFTDPLVAKVAAQIAADEANHVAFLRTALAASAVAQPNIKLDAIGSFATQTAFLTIARAFEDTGISAYGGAVTLLTGNNLQAAAQIALTEAQHGSAVRRFVIEEGNAPAPDVSIGPAVPAPAALDAIDVVPTSSQYFFVDAMGLSKIRTPSQVLMIVYATTATGMSSGGFFPQGLNGNVKTT